MSADNETWPVQEIKPSLNMAYFHMPPIWVGKGLERGEPGQELSALMSVIYPQTLSIGIKIDVCRDGVFIFDFQGWPDGCPVTIPTYIAEKGKLVPKEVITAQETAAEHRYHCTAVMNTHLACLSTAWSRVQKTHMTVRQVVTPASHFSVGWMGGNRHLNGITIYDTTLAYVAANMNFSHDYAMPQRRSILSLDAVHHSIALLENVLTSPMAEMPLMVKLLYLAGIHYVEHDFATALTLAWTVCEKLLEVLWHNYIKRQGEERDPAGNPLRVMNKDRRKTLEGIAYTASIISEVLSLAGLINHELYVNLAASRKARNAWLHNFTPVTGHMAHDAIRTAQQFIKEVSGIDLSINVSLASRM